MLKCAIFDLDGVIIDTAKYHYQAWNRLANLLGFEFTLQDNERLKGVSRMSSLEILLEVGGVELTPFEKNHAAALKNSWYVEYISAIGKEELLVGAEQFIMSLRENGIKVALGSASKNAPLILERTGITPLFDAIVDGNMVKNAKPDPQVFLLGSQMCGCLPADCAVFEDAKAGIEAANSASMISIGVGNEETKSDSKYFIEDFNQIDYLKFSQL